MTDATLVFLSLENLRPDPRDPFPILRLPLTLLFFLGNRFRKP